MAIGHHAAFAQAILCLSLAACSGGSSSETGHNAIAAVVQDVGLDPSGRTTRITFADERGLALALASNFEADGGQTAVDATVDGDEVTVEWDGYVSPADQVRAVGLADVGEEYAAVSTSDASAPGIAIDSAVQTPGLGGDVIEVSFSGAHVIEASAEDPAHWSLEVAEFELDLSGSTFDFDPVAQELTITLGELANLHASFELGASGLAAVNGSSLTAGAIAGAATGDTDPPALVSATQNLAEDEYGRVVDFTFDEAMDPVFATGLAHFSAADPDLALAVEVVSESTLRVAFNNPMVPGFDSVTLLGVVDAHGNAYPDQSVGLTQPAPVANAISGTPEAVAVENLGGDYLTFSTTQALDPDSALDPAHWALTVDGNNVDLALQELDYDLLQRTLTIVLDFDLAAGDPFQIDAVNALDVDGQSFATTFAGNVGGDAAGPNVLSITQNRNVDPAGRTVDVRFSEHVALASAETIGNYTEPAPESAVTATRQTGLDTVRLEFDGPVVPGDFTFGVSGVTDLAGNAMAPVVGLSFVSTDLVQPQALAASARAPAGAANDTLTVTFDDELVPDEVTDPAYWSVESPIGTPLSTVGTGITWSDDARTAVLTFANGVDLQRTHDFQVAFQTFRDLGGNVVLPGAIGGFVNTETTLPGVHKVARDGTFTNVLHVRFTEPCGQLTDLHDPILNPTGTRYVLRDSFGALRATPASAAAVDDGLGVDLTFGVTVLADDTLDVAGATDRAGNPLIPAFTLATGFADPTQPALDGPGTFLASISGEHNDQLFLAFDRPLSPWTATDPARYSISGPFGTVALDSSTISFDGTTHVTIALRGSPNNDLQNGGAYTLSFDGLWSALGAQRVGPDALFGQFPIGDGLAPDSGPSDVRIDPQTPNSLLIFSDETLDAAATAAASYDLNGGNLAISATRLSPRVVRATFALQPLVGDTLDYTLRDLAGNLSGSIVRSVAAADAQPPLIVSVAGVIVPGLGGDRIEVTFDESFALSTLAAANWTLKCAGQPIPTAGVRFQQAGSGRIARLQLPLSADLDANGPVDVTVANAADLSGNVSVATWNASGPVAGDAVAPAIAAAFVDWRADASGSTVVVLFDEHVDQARAGNPGSWSASGGVTVSAIEAVTHDQYRLTLSAPLAASGTLSITSLGDPADNVALLLSANPAE